MKFLLTSSGITNKLIEKSFKELIDKDLKEVIVAFIPTAANVEKDKSWMQKDIENLKRTGIKELNIVDIEKLPKKEWLSKLEKSDVICFGGGNTHHLLYWIRKSGIDKELKKLLKSRLYIGISAGSMIVGPDVSSNKYFFPEEKMFKLKDLNGLNYIPFFVIPHFMSPYFSEINHEKIKEFAKKASYPIYAVDDNICIKVINSKIEIIGNGKFLKIEK